MTTPPAEFVDCRTSDGLGTILRDPRRRPGFRSSLAFLALWTSLWLAFCLYATATYFYPALQAAGPSTHPSPQTLVVVWSLLVFALVLFHECLFVIDIFEFTSDAFVLRHQRSLTRRSRVIARADVQAVEFFVYRGRYNGYWAVFIRAPKCRRLIWSRDRDIPRWLGQVFATWAGQPLSFRPTTR